MKFFLVIACAIIAAASAQEWKPHTTEELLAIRKTCIEKTKLSAEDVEKLKTLTYTETMKPYLACFARETGIFDDKTGFNVPRAVKEYKYDLPEEKVKETFEKCINDNKKEGAKLFDLVIPIQKCLEATEVGEKIKAAFIKSQ